MLNDRLESGSSKKQNFCQVRKTWMACHITSTTMSKSNREELGGLLITASMKVKETEKAKKGVKNTGICSLNLRVFTEKYIFHIDL